jgi:hypothetical protein
MAAEMVEDYWQALIRDVPFAQYGTSALIQMALDDFSRLSNYTAPRANGSITPDTIFRGAWAGDIEGPIISQFLAQPVPYGMITIDQRHRTAAPGIDYLTAFPEWLSVQQGNPAYLDAAGMWEERKSPLWF